MDWMKLLSLVGKDQGDNDFQELATVLGEQPQVKETPLSYNDPDGRTLYHKYLNSGLELGFRAHRLNHIHIYVQSHEGYAPYQGSILDQNAQGWRRDALLQTLGPPDSQGGGKMDGLLGFIRPWVRYEGAGPVLRAEFSQDGRLWKCSLTLE
ncbi:hypothetical protein DMX05_12915 [Pseudomonas soli]|uniref:hypothetical protein n=1 Tax=Pseudomonas TaxID=286 RepID=UPI000624C5AA|nr:MULTISPECIES: hypothetical protein [Pseudomonas]PYC43189.1 hypothetical protein DMX05_12915 [Pseudomonas soli]CRI58444.1 hypothetical protein CCOS191_3908 [Pseudomonas sp. CCOS 191]